MSFQAVQAMETQPSSSEPELSFNDTSEAVRYARDHGLVMFDPTDPDGVDNAFTADEYDKRFFGATGAPE